MADEISRVLNQLASQGVEVGRIDVEWARGAGCPSKVINMTLETRQCSAAPGTKDSP